MIATIEAVANSAHIPVLAPELLDLVAPVEGETVVDCTFGAGGHSRLIAERIGASGYLVCMDRDPAAAERYEAFAAEIPCRSRFINADFADGLELLIEEGLRADAVIMDLGVSSPQIDTRERGFSYSYEAPLDMRMDPGQALSAHEIVNQWPQERLARVLYEFGEERNARGIAREIVARRPIETTSDLVEAIRSGMPPAARFGRGHPAKRSFQAIRIAVNGELESLDAALPRAWRLLGEGGRLAAISFHSLEDRRVKRFLNDLAQGCKCPPELPICVCGNEPEARLLARRAVQAGDREQEMNPRSSSARLRAALKLATDNFSTTDQDQGGS